MFFPLSEVIQFLEQYKYFVIFPIAIIEGPIIIIISGFLVYLGVLNAVIAFILLVIADVMGDSMYYGIGRFCRNSKFVKKSLSLLGYSDKSKESLEKHFETHKGKTFLFAKISHGIGGAIQVASGIARVRYSEFMTYSFIGTIPKTIVLLFLGYFMGSSYIKIDGFLNYIAIFVISLAVIGFVIYYVLRRFVVKFFSSPKI